MVILCFLFLAVMFISANFIGKATLTQISPDSRPGTQLFIGLIILVSLFATVVTFGKTILLPIVFIFIFELWRNRGKLKGQLRLERLTEIRWLLLFILPATILAHYFYLLPLETDLTFHRDHVFYGKLAEFMFRTGTETKNLNYFLTGENYTEVYHYFDIWLYAGIQKVLGVTTNQSVFIGVFLIFLPLVFQCLKDFTDRLYPDRKNVFLALVVTVLITRLSGSTFIFHYFDKESAFGDVCAWNYPKIILLTAMLIAFSYAVLFSGLRMLVFLTVLFSLCFATVLPVYAGFTILCYFWLNGRSSFSIGNLRLLTPLVGILIFILIFYLLFSLRGEYLPVHKNKVPFDTLHLRFRLDHFVKTSKYMFLGLLPVFTLLIVYRKNCDFQFLRRITIWLLVGCFIGLVSWLAIFTIPDSVQLWTSFYYSSAAFLFIAAFIILFRSGKWIALICLTVFIGADIYFPKNIQQHFFKSEFTAGNYRPLDGKRIAIFNDLNSITNIFDANESVFFSGLTSLVSFTDAELISFSVVEIKPQDAFFEQIITRSNLYQLKPFVLGRDEEFYADYQKKMFSNLRIEYIAVHKKRTFPIALKEANFRKLGVQDENFFFYGLLKN